MSKRSIGDAQEFWFTGAIVTPFVMCLLGPVEMIVAPAIIVAAAMVAVGAAIGFYFEDEDEGARSGER